MLKEQLRNFRQSHQIITDLLGQIGSVARSYQEVRPKLRALQQVLLEHFAVQSDKFFEKLRRCYAEDLATLKIIEFLSVDVKDKKVKLLMFFDKHSGELGDMHARGFSRDFFHFSQEILARIQIEVEYLFPLLERS